MDAAEGRRFFVGRCIHLSNAGEKSQPEKRSESRSPAFSQKFTRFFPDYHGRGFFLRPFLMP